MQLKEQSPVTCDVLIIGGGGAALRGAIEAKKRGVDVHEITPRLHVIGFRQPGDQTSLSGWGDHPSSTNHAYVVKGCSILLPGITRHDGQSFTTSRKKARNSAVGRGKQPRSKSID